jgi:ATP-dependent Clp protease ATP-binding subunit ClpB
VAHPLLYIKVIKRTKNYYKGEYYMDFEKFTHKSQEAINGAHTLAVEFNHQEIAPLHLFLSLLNQEQGIVSTIIEKSGASASSIREQVSDTLQSRPSVSGPGAQQVYFAKDTSAVLNEAVKIAKKMKDDYVSVEHLFLAILEKSQECKDILEQVGVTYRQVMDGLKEVRGNQRVTSNNPEDTFQALDKYSRNLTEMAQQGKLDPVIGRDDEIRRIIQILSRRTKNNPVLIGDPGVGKTAIVEGLAIRIIRGDVPEGLKGRKLMALDSSRPCSRR